MTDNAVASDIRFDLVLPCGDCLPVAEPPFCCTRAPEGWRVYDAHRRRTVVRGETFAWQDQRYLAVSSARVPCALWEAKTRLFWCAIHRPELLARAAAASFPGHLFGPAGAGAACASFLALCAAFAFPPANARAPERSLSREALMATHFLATINALPREAAPEPESAPAAAPAVDHDKAKIRPKMPTHRTPPHTLEKMNSRDRPTRDPRYFLAPGES